MTTISTGTVTTTGSRTYIMGTSSELDTSALIDVAVSAVTAEADEIQVDIDENALKIEAYSELQSLTEDFQTSLETLKSVVGFSSDTSSIFDARSGYMDSNSSIEATSLLSVAVEEGSELGTYEIIVEQKAQSMKVISDSQTSSSDALGLEGSFTINITENDAQQIDVTSDMTLSDIKDAINDLTEESGVSASILQVGEDEYKLILNGEQTNQDIEIISLSGDDIMQSLGVTDASSAFQNIVQDAQGAILQIDGITVTRDDNSIDDLLDGVTIDIENADPDTTITLSIDNDTESVKSAIEAFIEAYNALREFVVTNQTVSSDGEVSEDAALFGDTLMKSLNSAISSIIGDDTESSLATLRDIGITYTDDNYLEISDETLLDDALLDNYDALTELFSSSYESSSDEFSILSNSSSISSIEITFDITVDGDGNITSVSVDGDDSLFEISGTRIVGADGSAYEGLNFSYQGTTSQSITFNLNQGIADRLYNVVDDYADSSNGLLVDAASELEETNEDLEEEISDIQERATALQERLVDKYAEMEAKISVLKLLQEQVQAIIGSSDDD